MEPAELITVLASVAGAFVGGLCGLGSYMLIIPAMSLALPIQTVILTCCLSGPFLTVLLFWKYRRQCRWGSLAPMLAGALPGTLCGVWVITVVRESILQLLLGVVLLIFLYWQLKGRTQCDRGAGKESWQMGGISGYFAGLLGASISVGGPSVAAYGLYCGWSPQAFLGTTGAFFLVRSIMATATQGLAGLYTSDIVHLALFMVPSCLLGTALSFPVVKRINVGTFRILVRIVILMAACSCLWHARELYVRICHGMT